MAAEREELMATLAVSFHDLKAKFSAMLLNDLVVNTLMDVLVRSICPFAEPESVLGCGLCCAEGAMLCADQRRSGARAGWDTRAIHTTLVRRCAGV